MLSYEGTGKNIEKAIENALFELKAVREDVDIKILEEGGLFKKAKVLVTISDDCVEKYQKKADKKKAEIEDVYEELDVKAIFKDAGETIKEEKKEEKPAEKEVKKVEKENKKSEKKSGKISGKDFVKGLLKELDIEAEVFVEEDAESVKVLISGGCSGDLIGYRGECLNAIQYVASIIENDNSETRKKFILDIENYRGKREETLKALAHRMESKVEKTGHSAKLEPMSANERRIIHTELQASLTVTTTSKGQEPNRFVVILPKNISEVSVGDEE